MSRSRERPQDRVAPAVDPAKVARVFGDLPALKTPRLILRRLSRDDLADVHEYASDPEVARFVTWDVHVTLDDSRQFLEWAMEQYTKGEIGPWGIFHRGDRKVIGTCGYAWWNTRHDKAEIGYAIGRPYWNQGLMTEAVWEVLDFGFGPMELNRIEARCLPENAASERVMKKVGMTFEGILREHVYVKGRYDDLKLYSIVRSDWLAQQSQVALRGSR